MLDKNVLEILLEYGCICSSKLWPCRVPQIVNKSQCSQACGVRAKISEYLKKECSAIRVRNIVQVVLQRLLAI